MTKTVYIFTESQKTGCPKLRELLDQFERPRDPMENPMNNAMIQLTMPCFNEEKEPCVMCNRALYCPITGKMLSWAKGIIGIYIEEPEEETNE